MIKLIAFLKSKPGMTREAFTQRWLEHTRLSGQMPGLRGYYINVAGAAQPDGGDAIYDGTAELWWDSLDDMERAFASEIGIAAGKDADEFCDVRIHLYTDEYEIVPGPHNRTQA